MKNGLWRSLKRIATKERRSGKKIKDYVVKDEQWSGGGRRGFEDR